MPNNTIPSSTGITKRGRPPKTTTSIKEQNKKKPKTSVKINKEQYLSNYKCHENDNNSKPNLLEDNTNTNTVFSNDEFKIMLRNLFVNEIAQSNIVLISKYVSNIFDALIKLETFCQTLEFTITQNTLDIATLSESRDIYIVCILQFDLLHECTNLKKNQIFCVDITQLKETLRFISRGQQNDMKRLNPSAIIIDPHQNQIVFMKKSAPGCGGMRLPQPLIPENFDGGCENTAPLTSFEKPIGFKIDYLWLKCHVQYFHKQYENTVSFKYDHSKRMFSVCDDEGDNCATFDEDVDISEVVKLSDPTKNVSFSMTFNADRMRKITSTNERYQDESIRFINVTFDANKTNPKVKFQYKLPNDTGHIIYFISPIAKEFKVSSEPF